MIDDDFDPEEHAGDTADRIAVRYPLKIIGKVLPIVLAVAAVDVGARLFAVFSVWHLPAWAIGFVLSIVAADLMWITYRLAADIRKHRRDKAEAAHLTKGQQANRRMERLSADRAAHGRRRSWRTRLRRPRWWISRALDVVYLACFGVVITAWYSPMVGGIAVIVTFAVAVVLRWLGNRFTPTFLAMIGFFDPAAPKDTPEV